MSILRRVKLLTKVVESYCDDIAYSFKTLQTYYHVLSVRHLKIVKIFKLLLSDFRNYLQDELTLFLHKN